MRAGPPPAGSPGDPAGRPLYSCRRAPQSRHFSPRVGDHVHFIHAGDAHAARLTATCSGGTPSPLPRPAARPVSSAIASRFHAIPLPVRSASRTSFMPAAHMVSASQPILAGVRLPFGSLSLHLLRGRRVGQDRGRDRDRGRNCGRRNARPFLAEHRGKRCVQFFGAARSGHRRRPGREHNRDPFLHVAHEGSSILPLVDAGEEARLFDGFAARGVVVG